MCRPWRTSLRNNHHGSDIGSEDTLQVPEMMEHYFFQQTSAFFRCIRTCQQWIRQHQAYPATRPHYLKRQVQKKQVTIGLTTPLHVSIAAKIVIPGR